VFAKRSVYGEVMRLALRALLVALAVTALGGCDLLWQIDVPQGSSNTWRARDGEDHDAVTIDISDKVTVRYGNEKLSSVADTQDTVRTSSIPYSNKAGIVANVYRSKDHFNVKDPSDQRLWWTVSNRDGKVRISNKENTHVFLIKASGNKFKVTHQRHYKRPIKVERKRLGKVKYYPDDKRIKVKDAAGETRFRATQVQRSPVWGVLLMDNIPEQERFIIMAELAVIESAP